MKEAIARALVAVTDLHDYLEQTDFISLTIVSDCDRVYDILEYMDVMNYTDWADCTVLTEICDDWAGCAWKARCAGWDNGADSFSEAVVALAAVFNAYTIFED